MAIDFIAPRTWHSNLTIFGVPDEGYSRNAKFDINVLLLSLYQYLFWWTFIPRRYHPPSRQYCSCSLMHRWP